MDIQEYTLHDRLPRPITFKGLLLADCRYDDGVKLRWTDMALYRVLGRSSEYRYALQITGRSVVYHAPGGPCANPERHRTSTIKNIKKSTKRWNMLIPCDKKGCTPGDLEELNETDKILEEKEEHSVYLCLYATDVIDRIYKHSGHISELAADLLFKAAQNDTHIYRARKLRWKI